jgi:hypothetical protein
MLVDLVVLCTYYVMDGTVPAEGYFQVCILEEFGDLT